MIAGFVWQVPARIIRWKDGDTCEVDIDAGWRNGIQREGVRLMRLHCPELDEAGGVAAWQHAITLAPPGAVVVVVSKALNKGGLWTPGSQESLARTLGDIRLSDGRDFATVMVAAGHGTVTGSTP